MIYSDTELIKLLCDGDSKWKLSRFTTRWLMKVAGWWLINLKDEKLDKVLKTKKRKFKITPNNSLYMAKWTNGSKACKYKG